MASIIVRVSIRCNKAKSKLKRRWFHERDFLRKKKQQMKSLEFIASEDFTSRTMMEAIDPCLTKQMFRGIAW